MSALAIKKRILSFHHQLQSDNNHRYKSWEHCFKYFSQGKLDEDIACLHLAFYLASWGMYRGSSFLLWKDYLVHREVVQLTAADSRKLAEALLNPPEPNAELRAAFAEYRAFTGPGH